VGAGLGALLGALFAIISGVIQFGTPVITNLLWGDMLGSMGLATGVGCLLSLAGVLYPAMVAARMQPVEAMRVEE
jgi:ABC-type antimicrobial peptide transport system permease subunit